QWISYQLISNPSQCLEHWFAKVCLQLRAQATHVDVQQIGVAQPGPYPLGDVRSRQRAACVLHEDFQQGEFPAGEVHVLLLQLDRVTEQIQPHAAMGNHRLLHRRLPTQQRADVRQKLLEAERLRQVVVRTEVEPLDAILHRVSRAEDQYRFVEARTAPFRQQVQTVAVGQTEIDNVRVVAIFHQFAALRFTDAYQRNGVGTLADPMPQEFTQP